MNPIARRADVLVQDVGTDTLVYDRRTDQVHSLTPVVALVFKRADGELSVAELTAALRTELAPDADDRVTVLALRELAAVGLLDRPPSDGTERKRRRHRTRRQTAKPINRRSAVGAMLAGALVIPAVAFAIPGITTIVAPTPMMAASGGPACIGNPGNNKCVGKAGEAPNGKPGWGSGSNGHGDVRGNATQGNNNGNGNGNGGGGNGNGNNAGTAGPAAPAGNSGSPGNSGSAGNSGKPKKGK